MTIVVMPLCLGASGLVRTVARPYLLRCAPLVQTFWPLMIQPPSVLVALVLMPAASDPAPGSLNSWHQITSWFRAGNHPARDLLGGGVLDQREDDPAGDPVRRALDARGAELLLDHQLLDRARVPAPWLRPVRHHVAGLRSSPCAWRPRRGR